MYTQKEINDVLKIYDRLNCQASFKLTPENELTPTNATH